ncbi:hypothetical protein A9Q99_04365 [Gammaproteobacteria bacterium 45_16_T64]|nr:hypothetical protein A9Q99_04365 [Gammaproteobacteria bacterium 45_16_T64]
MRTYPGKRHSGQVMAEYIIASVFLGLFVWYAIVGGSVDGATGKGGMLETDVSVTGTGAVLDRATGTNVAVPGLVQALHNKQVDFSNEIYKP